MTSKIYLDMDGVVVDLELGVIRTLGKPFDDDWYNLPEGFFRTLPKMQDADLLVSEVMRLATRYNHSVAILTAIPRRRRFKLAAQHKQEWIQEHYPQIMEFNIGPYAIDKQKFAKPGDILIDDSHLNIPQWCRAGGIGIMHSSAETSLLILEEILYAKTKASE